MCLLFVAFKTHPSHPLVVAANRDEFFARETKHAHRWDEGLVAGRDGLAGGTWLGVSPQGGARFAALTNRRGGASRKTASSRGELTTGFLTGTASALDYAAQIHAQGQDYAGFNLLVGDADSLVYVSNEPGAEVRELIPGLYGLSNGALDEPWPKLARGKQRFRDCLNTPALVTDALLALMDDREKAADHELPSTGLPLELERRLSPAFIENDSAAAGPSGLDDYGTLCSTALITDVHGGFRFHERNFDRQGKVSLSRLFVSPHVNA